MYLYQHLAVTSGKTPTLERQGLACRAWVWFHQSLGPSPGFCFPARLSLPSAPCPCCYGLYLCTYSDCRERSCLPLFISWFFSSCVMPFWVFTSLLLCCFFVLITPQAGSCVVTWEKMAITWVRIALICSGFQGTTSGLDQNLLGPDSRWVEWFVQSAAAEGIEGAPHLFRTGP